MRIAEGASGFYRFYLGGHLACRGLFEGLRHTFWWSWWSSKRCKGGPGRG